MFSVMVSFKTVAEAGIGFASAVFIECLNGTRHYSEIRDSNVLVRSD